ncbi:MAG: Lar family restriction alleviation protein [Synergistaceae bacterium]|nr:Lar family restriction alleviation protein [Synergistaceae bacterium]MBR1602547.1 Lar family restriction alleviation protein [Synergistaceae bacterium]
MSEVKLKPCAKCGGEGKLTVELPDKEVLMVVGELPQDRWCYVDCQKCYYGTNIFNTPEEAVEAWNRLDEVLCVRPKNEQE